MTAGSTRTRAVAQRSLGWLAVALASLLASVPGYLAGTRGIGGWPLLVEMLVLIGVSVSAIRWPRAGGGLLVLTGLTTVAWFAILRLPEGNAEALWRSLAAMLQVIFLFALTGALFWLGRPDRPRVAYMALTAPPFAVMLLAAAL